MTVFVEFAQTPAVGVLHTERAQLYALKIFGCHGTTALVAKAMDGALDPTGDGDFADRLDVVNL